MSRTLNHTITVCANDAGQHRWPNGVTQRLHNFSDRPWSLPENTHAIIAQGHDGDPKSLSALLNHKATHVYLIASAKRAKEVMQMALPLVKNKDLIDERVSSPAGLNLGGNTSSEIALSVLAEIQWRHHNQSNTQSLTEKLYLQPHYSKNKTTTAQCPGKRP